MFAGRETWSSERIDQLKRCFQAGLSSAMIAREMGLTRNAVIGKLSRLGLSRPKDLVAKHLDQKRSTKFARPKRRRLNVFTPSLTFTTAYPVSSFCETSPIYEGRGCTLLELGQRKCRWPIDSPSSQDFFFCGNEPVAGLPYCEAHARLAYRPAARPRRRRPDSLVTGESSHHRV
jgi:GcrA cell cycle regulator